MNDPAGCERRLRGDEAGARPVVRDWLGAQTAETIYLSSVAVAELLFGVARRRTGGANRSSPDALDGLLALFEGRILPFDEKAARRTADLAVAARNAGGGFPTPDGYIAAIAAAHGFVVATRDASAFQAAGVPTIDPWTTAG